MGQDHTPDAFPQDRVLSSNHHRFFPDDSNTKHKLVQRPFSHESVMIRRPPRKRPDPTPAKDAPNRVYFSSQEQDHSIMASFPFIRGFRNGVTWRFLLFSDVCLSFKPIVLFIKQFSFTFFLVFLFCFCFNSTCLCTSQGVHYQFTRRLVSGRSPLNP